MAEEPSAAMAEPQQLDTEATLAASRFEELPEEVPEARDVPPDTESPSREVERRDDYLGERKESRCPQWCRRAGQSGAASPA